MFAAGWLTEPDVAYPQLVGTRSHGFGFDLHPHAGHGDHRASLYHHRLEAPLRDALGQRLLDRRRLPLVEFVVVDSTVGTDLDVAARGDLVSRLNNALEIGRASCRERVCQSV